MFALVETMLTPVKTMFTLIEGLFTPVEGMFMPRKRHVYAPVSVREGKLEFVTRDFETLRGFHSADECSGGKIAGIIRVNNCNIGNIGRVAQVSVLFLIFLPDNLAG